MRDRLQRLLAPAILASLSVFGFSQSIVINEFMSVNSGTISDEDGEYPGWIELYNASGSAVDLAGWGISDNPAEPYRWVFPSITIAPGAYLIVWSSGKNRTPDQLIRTNGLLREVYMNIPGTSVNDLIDHWSYPDQPTFREVVTDVFESPTDIGEYYGQRMHGFIAPPVSGTYRFWIASDDNGRLLLSTNENPANALQVAHVPEWTSPREWTKFTEQTGTRYLQAGRLYYICALMKEHTGGDNLAVRWQLPGGTIEEPIPVSRLFIDVSSALHTNFTLDPAGSSIRLTAPGGMLIDSVDPISLPVDVSYGRASDGGDTWGYFMDPTPRTTNAAAACYPYPEHRLALRDEKLGRSSRSTGMVISEIMYRPAPREDNRALEYVELYNSDLTDVDLEGWRLTGTIQYTFAAGTRIAPGHFLVVAKNAADIQSVYGISNVIGSYEGTLDAADGVIELRNRSAALLLSAEYGAFHPWPAAAAGAGHSLVLSRPSWGEDSIKAWRASAYKGGSPGEQDPVATDLLRHIKINEFLAHTDLPQVDYIELYNHSDLSVDLSGAFLSDKPDQNRFQIPAGTVIAPGGFVVFEEDELGFGLSANGEAVYLTSPDNRRVVDAVQFGAQINGVSMGRYPDGAEEFYLLAAPTPGASNGALFSSDIVINEIMFNPVSGLDEDTYIELYNKSNQTVDVSDWRFLDGIRFTIPQGTHIAAGGYLVIAKDEHRLLDRYPDLNAANTIGNFSGRLANSGERITLARPVVRTLEPTGYAVVQDVTYSDGGRWGKWANRDGSSLELIDPRANNRLAANWTHSDETGKSQWITVEHTGVLDHGMESADQLHILMPSGGVCLIDNVEVFIPGGGNRVPNSTFESGIAGWVAQGNHVASAWHTEEGYNSSRSLRVEAAGGGDTGANRIRVNLTSGFSAGQTVTIRAKARWLAGHSDIILRLKGNYLEAVGTMQIPADLGTPGRRNSAYAPNIGPAIYDVRHYPTLPKANQPVTITARVCDPDGIGSVQLWYRLDPSSTFHSVTMRDDGQGGDLIASDGIYTAVIGGQAAEALIAYHIRATDAHTQPVTATFPDDIAEYEALVRIGESRLGRDFPAYRMWFTQSVISEWSNRERLSNQRLPGTLIYGDRVIHNIGARYRGSPWIRPQYSSPVSGNVSAYSFHVPRDDRLLGSREFNLDHLEQPGRDNTLQREKTVFWLGEQLGVPFSHQTYLYVVVNGARRGVVYTDSQHIDSDYVKTWWPDDDRGELFKIDDWFEFNDSWGFSHVNAQLGNYTTVGGEKKQARYRWSWNKRSNRGLDDDYSQLFQLADAVNTPGADYTAAVAAWVDVEQWMRVFALRRIAGDWDGYGYERGKNTWTYKPARDRFKMIPWDLDFSLGGGSHGPETSLFGSTNDPAIAAMYNHAPFRRAYLRAFHDAVYGPFDAAVVGPVMAQRWDAFQSEGLQVAFPDAVTTWITQRRNYVIGVLNGESPGNFAVTTNSGNNFSAAAPWQTLQGVAPVQAKTLTFNGRPYPVAWTTVTAWTVQIPLQPGANPIHIAALDSFDRPLQGLEANITITYTGPDADPQNHLVMNEIMYNPVEPDAEFVEIHNTSATHGFDLSGLRIRGIDFNFADGTLIAPGGYLVVVKDRFAFYAAYGSALPVAGEYSGRLHPQGETLTLVRPASDTEEELIFDRVVYAPTPPWPQAADGQGPSLQRIDPHQPGDHPGNWAAVSEEQAPQWQFVTLTGMTHPSSPSDRIYIYLHAAGEFHIDDIFLARGSVPMAGQNHIQNGNFEQPLAGTWTVSSNHAQSSVTTAVKRSGASSLHVVAASGGSTQASAIWQDGLALDYGQVYTLSYWYLPNPNGATVTVRLRYSESAPQGIISTHSVLSGHTPPPLTYTPAARNSVYAALPAFPPLWINEIQPVNTEFPDSYGQTSPWVELYNSGDQTLSLADFYLSDTYNDRTQWAFPAFAEIGPGQHRLVRLTGQPEKTTADEWHAGFQIDPDKGVLVLSRSTDQIITYIDSLEYDAVAEGLSYGRFPDGADNTRVFFVPTPAYANDNTNGAVLHYWHFNNLAADTLTAVAADYSVNPGAQITYPGTGAGYMDRVNEGTSLNARMLEPAGNGLRVRNPSDTRQLLFAVPTTGFRNIVLSYAVTRTTAGATEQMLQYRLSPADPWMPAGNTVTVTEDYEVLRFDFSGVLGTSDNPDFAVRILFGGSTASGSSGNNRFDNVTVEGTPLAGSNLPPQLIEPVPFTKTVERNPVQIDLSAYFVDPENDVLTFAATAAKPFVAAPSVSGSILTLTPLYRGDTVITVTAGDGSNPEIQTSFRVLVYPAAHVLRLGRFAFNYWSAENAEHAFPDGMLFLQSDVSDPGVAEPLDYPYFIPHDDYHADDTVGLPYKTTSRTRLNGLGELGIAFVNTGRGRDLGGALTAVDTTGLDAVQVRWLGGTVLANSRRYAIRLQYRVGIEGDFADVLHNGQPVEYVVLTNDHTQPLGPIELPAEAIDQTYVQLLWRYYYVDGTSGPRAQLRLDEIAVSGVLEMFENLGLFAQWWLTSDCQLYDHCGSADLTRDGRVDLEDFAVLATQWMQNN